MKQFFCLLTALLWLGAVTPCQAQSTAAGSGLTINVPGLQPRLPPILSGIGRTWDTGWLTNIPNFNMMGILPTSATPNWTVPDAIMAYYHTHHMDSWLFTMGDIPAWCQTTTPTNRANPCDFPDMETYVSEVIARYPQIIAFETLNEPGCVFWWPECSNPTASPTSQVNNYTASTLSMNWQTWAYNTLKAANPNLIITTPSWVSQQGVFQADSAYSQGMCGLSDVHAMHAYPINIYYGQNVEQYIQQDHIFRQVMTNYGCGSHPIWWTEGDYSTNTTNPILIQAYSAIWPMLAASEGIQKAMWYAFDAPGINNTNNYGRLSDGGAGLDYAGTAFHTARKWVIGATWTSPIARQVLTSNVRNPNGSGAVVNTSTLPTYWDVYNPDGLTITVKNVSGTTGIDLNIAGTGSTGYLRIDTEQNSHITAVLNQYLDVSANILVPPGTTNVGLNRVEIGYDQYNSSHGYITEGLGADFPIYQSLTIGNDYHAQFPATAAATAFIVPDIALYYATGAVNMNIRINSVTEDSGSIYLGKFTKPGGYQGLVVWDANGINDGNNQTYTVPSGYTYMRDWTGKQTAVTTGQVLPLSNQPILLENQQWKMWVH